MFSQRLQNLHPYVPGEQPDDRPYIKLNANENPYPPHPSVAQAVAEELASRPERLGLYPDPDADGLRASICDMLNATGGVLCRATVSGTDCSPADCDRIGFAVTPDMVFCGNGSDEVLSFVFYTLFGSDAPLVLPEHTYSFYPVYCGYYGIGMERVPLNPDWTLDTEAMLERANRLHSPIIFANPNAPTGIALSRDDIAHMLQAAPQDVPFVVDEAYCDFGGQSCIPLLARFRNLVVVRTLSKSFSFAGMRLGFVVSHPDVIQAVFRAKNSFNHFPVDVLAQVAGSASCKAAWYYAQNARRVVAERDAFADFLRGHGWLVVPSSTNFVLAKKPGLGGKDVYQAAKRGGVLIRHFDVPGIDDCVRITIGTAGQMQALRTILEGL